MVVRRACAAPAGWVAYDWFVFAVFFSDCVLNFRTGYFGEGGELVMNPGRIALHYLRTWFLVDVLSTLPWEWAPPPTARIERPLLATARW